MATISPRIVELYRAAGHTGGIPASTRISTRILNAAYRNMQQAAHESSTPPLPSRANTRRKPMAGQYIPPERVWNPQSKSFMTLGGPRQWDDVRPQRC